MGFEPSKRPSDYAGTTVPGWVLAVPAAAALLAWGVAAGWLFTTADGLHAAWGGGTCLSGAPPSGLMPKASWRSSA